MQHRSDLNYNFKTNDKNRSTSKITNERETAQYIADLVLELRNLAKAHSFIALQGLLEVSYYEAYSAANKIVVPAGEMELLEELARAATG